MRRVLFIAAFTIAGLLSPLCRAYSGGTGTAEDPYQIADANDLMELAADTGNYDKSFILTADIDLEGQIFTTAIIALDPLDDDDEGFEGTVFNGRFDGNGHTVNNLKITGGKSYLGLFGLVGQEGQIKNLGIENHSISGVYYVGSICGANGRGTIINCYASSGTVDGSHCVGGLCGYSDGTISDCYAECSVSGNCYVGGLTGGSSSSAMIIKSYATGPVSDSADLSELIGGLCGYNSGIISDCYATGEVKCMALEGIYVGGLCGYNGYDAAITSCYASGTVQGNHEDVGGLCGRNDMGNISNCYALGEVKGSRSVGGFCGRNEEGDLYYCYSAGKVSGSFNVGGLCGWNYYNKNIVDCFWDTETSGLTTSCGGTGKNTEEMKMLLTFLEKNWNIVSEDDLYVADWILPDNEYPHLMWEITMIVPDVTGLSQSDALTALAETALMVEVTGIASETISADTVISQSPSAGLPVPGGSTIHLVISLGLLYSGGAGTPGYPYKIGSAADWQVLMSTSADWDKHFNLIADIDLQGVLMTHVGNNTSPFTGTLNGNNHIIWNINSSTGGLFGQTLNAKIENLGVKNATIFFSEQTGTLVNYNVSSDIINCYCMGSVKSYYFHVGGLVGYNDSGIISRCYYAGSVNGIWDSIGGIAGVNYHGTITDCYSTAIVSGNSNIGGLVGSNIGSIVNCYNQGNIDSHGGCVGGLAGMNYYGIIKACRNEGAIRGRYTAGGLVGMNDKGSVESCYNIGIVYGAHESGGLIGHNNQNLLFCYNKGIVYGLNNVGGLVGYSNGDYSLIDSCYSTGEVHGESNVGGIEGYIESGKVNNSFWDIQSSGTTNGVGDIDPDPNGVTGKTTEEMKTISTFIDAGWDFTNETANGTTNIWRMCVDGINYPKLSWQSAEGDFNCPDGVNTEDLDIVTACWLETTQAKSDIDDDDVVTLADYMLLAGQWLLTDCGECGKADITGDGNVDQADLEMLISQWLLQENTACQIVDLDADGRVDLADYAVFARHWLEQ